MIKILLVFLSATLLSSLANAYAVAGPGIKWGAYALGTPGGNVTWSLLSAPMDCAHSSEIGNGAPLTCVSLDNYMPAGYVSEIERAFDTWSDVADINFIQVPDSNEAYNQFNPSVDIRIAGHIFDGTNGALAHAYYPTTAWWGIAGDIHFDIDDTWSIGGVGGYDIYSVALHEIGHAMGIGHSDISSDVMAPYYNGAITGLKSGDIAAAQEIYGVAPVPLPAGLPLFAAALMGLIGIGRSRR